MNGRVKSPITGESMGRKLIPSPQIKNLIDGLIQNGSIGGDLATKWKDKFHGKKRREDAVKLAKQGDIKAMEWVGFHFEYGGDGFEKDIGKALVWFQNAHDAGSIFGTAHLGGLLSSGHGGEDHKMKGAMLLGIAAGRGSDWAAFHLGMLLAEGHHGFSVDVEEAKRLLSLALSDSISHKTLTDEFKDKAREKLNGLVVI